MGILRKGDKVRVKSLEWYRDNCSSGGGVVTKGNTFVSDMKKYCGREAIITEYFSDIHFCIDIDSENWGWTIGMVEVCERKPNYDVFKFGDLYVKVNTEDKTIFPEFYNTPEEATASIITDHSLICDK